VIVRLALHQSLGIHIARIQEMVLRQQSALLQRSMDRPDRLRIWERGFGRFDMRDQVWAILGICFGDMHFVANPRKTAFGAHPRFDIIRRDDQLDPWRQVLLVTPAHQAIAIRRNILLRPYLAEHVDSPEIPHDGRGIWRRNRHEQAIPIGADLRGEGGPVCLLLWQPKFLHPLTIAIKPVNRDLCAQPVGASCASSFSA
jgi:hypothetical protein